MMARKKTRSYEFVASSVPDELEVEALAAELRYDGDGNFVSVVHVPINVGYELPSPPSRYTGPRPLDRNAHPIESRYVPRPTRPRPQPEPKQYTPQQWAERRWSYRELVKWEGDTTGVNERED